MQNRVPFVPISFNGLITRPTKIYSESFAAQNREVAQDFDMINYDEVAALVKNFRFAEYLVD